MYRIFLTEPSNYLLVDIDFTSEFEAENYIKDNHPCKFCGDGVQCQKFTIKPLTHKEFLDLVPAFVTINKLDCTPDMLTTYEHDKIELEYYEKLLAARFNLVGEPHEIHNWLVEIDRENRIVEDELVADWQSAFSSVMMYK